MGSAPQPMSSMGGMGGMGSMGGMGNGNTPQAVSSFLQNPSFQQAIQPMAQAELAFQQAGQPFPLGGQPSTTTQNAIGNMAPITQQLNQATMPGATSTYAPMGGQTAPGMTGQMTPGSNYVAQMDQSNPLAMLLNQWGANGL